MSLVCTPPYIYLFRVSAISHPRPAMANPTHIRRLPVELITEIFKSLDSIADVTHLARTSQFFSDIWKLHIATICGAILPRIILFYEQVSELAVAVIRQKMGRGDLERILKDSSINKAKVTVWLSRAAALQIQKYESTYDQVPPEFACSCNPRPSGYGPDAPKLCVHERSKFFFYYELWMLTTMPRASTKAILESMPLSRLNLLRRFGNFRIIYPSGLGRISMEDPEEYWPKALELLSQCFEIHFRRAMLPPPRCWRTIFSAD